MSAARSIRPIWLLDLIIWTYVSIQALNVHWMLVREHVYPRGGFKMSFVNALVHLTIYPQKVFVYKLLRAGYVKLMTEILVCYKQYQLALSIDLTEFWYFAPTSCNYMKFECKSFI